MISVFTCAVKSSYSSTSSTRPFHSSAGMVPVYMQVRKIVLTNIDRQPRPVHYTTGCHHLQVYNSCCPLTHLHYEGESCFLITAKKSGTKLLMQGQKLAAPQAFVVAEPCRLTNTWVFLLHSPCLFLRPLHTHLCCSTSGSKPQVRELQNVRKALQLVWFRLRCIRAGVTEQPTSC